MGFENLYLCPGFSDYVLVGRERENFLNLLQYLKFIACSVCLFYIGLCAELQIVWETLTVVAYFLNIGQGFWHC
jgi:hypothetical protein